MRKDFINEEGTVSLSRQSYKFLKRHINIMQREKQENKLLKLFKAGLFLSEKAKSFC